MRRRIVWLLALALSLSLAAGALAADEPEDELEEYAQRLAEAQKDIRTRKTGSYGMTPLSGAYVKDGTYPVAGESSSSFFKIRDAELTVRDGVMTVRFTIPSMSYLYVYPGTGKEAAAAGEENWLGCEEKGGQTVFTLPLSALNAPVPCAAYSKARQKWYDRELCFDASSLPAEALTIALPDYALIEDALRAYAPEGRPEVPEPEPETEDDADWLPAEPVAVPLADGEYSIALDLAGGSGRASVSSPALMIVREGRAWARLTWSSAYYDYMLMGDSRFDNLTADGGLSVFEIPIPAMDEPVTVVADTTAMGDPVEIRYELTFYYDSIGSKGQIPQVAAQKVLFIAAAVMVLGGVLNYTLKKKRR